MDYPARSQNSFDTLSIKLTENQLPSNTYIRNSQEQVSLTYTVSLQNIQQQNTSLGNIPEKEEHSIQVEKNDMIYSRAHPFFHQQTQKSEFQQSLNPHEMQMKKSILKISNINFQNALQNSKDEHTPEISKSRKFVVRSGGSGIFSKKKHHPIDSAQVSRPHSQSKQKDTDHCLQGFGEKLLLKKHKFYSMKKDQIVQPLPLRKNQQLFRKRSESKKAGPSTQRTRKKLPALKGLFSKSAPVEPVNRKKAFTCHQNAQESQRSTMQLSERVLLGRSYKMSENDQKARLYLQKIIQSRNSVIHYSDNNKQSPFFNKDFKENYEEIW